MPGTPSALLNSTSCTRNTATPWYKLKFEPIDTVNGQHLYTSTKNPHLLYPNLKMHVCCLYTYMYIHTIKNILCVPKSLPDHLS